MGKKYLESRMGSALRFVVGLAPAVKPDRPAKHKSAKQFNGFSHAACRVGRAPAKLTDHGAVHDKPDDKLVVFEYESFTRDMAASNAILLCAGRVRSKSEGGTAGGAINCSHSTRKIGGDRFYNLKKLKQGIGPALFFDRPSAGIMASAPPTT
jgi:hypothetical protein